MTKKTDKEFAEYWLWNETAFPLETPELILEQAQSYIVGLSQPATRHGEEGEKE